MKKNFFLIILSYAFISIFSLQSYDNDSMDKIMNCEWDLSFQDLYGIPLGGRNLSYMSFNYAYMKKSFLEKSTCYKTCFYCANLQEANLTNTNLSSANFENAKMHNTKLDGTIVTGANFKGVKGLTNEQKKYLREHGAINVPINIEYALEECCKKVGYEVAQKKNLPKRFFNLFVKKYKQYFKSNDASIQTSNKPRKHKR